MRKLLRSIARHNMEKAEIQRMNKKRNQYANGSKSGSFFSQHWREYCK